MLDVVEDLGVTQFNGSKPKHYLLVKCSSCGEVKHLDKRKSNTYIDTDFSYNCSKCSNKIGRNIKPDKFKIGNKLNMLTILKHINKKMLEVMCDCGNCSTITRSKFGRTKSCGCIQWKTTINDRFGDNTGIHNLQWRSIVNNAKSRNLMLSISSSEAYNIFLDQDGKCALSGLPIEFRKKYSTASLDRIDSSRGYTIDNVQWVHADINKMKTDFNENYFKHLCSQISSESISLNFEDVLIKPKPSNISSRSDVDILTTHTIRGISIKSTPIIAANMSTVGTFEMAKILNKNDVLVALHKFYSYEDYLNETSFLNENKNRYFLSIGESYQDLSLLKRINDNITPVTMICIDVANGYRYSFHKFVRDVRSEFPNAIIMCGNVTTSIGVTDLVNAGVDIIKVQIGPGMACSTKIKTGVGYGTLSTILECSIVAKKRGVLLVSDGGIRHPGDISKAICAGADFVMIGGLFASTYEADGDIISKYYENKELEWVDGNFIHKQPIQKKYKIFYGMSSQYAQEKHGTGMKEYRASEGVVHELEITGHVLDVVKELLGGIRSTGTYIGAESIKNFGKCATFIKVNRVHDRNV